MSGYMDMPPQKPAIVETVTIQGGQDITSVTVEAEITAYTSAADECGKSDGITASGRRVSRGMVAAPHHIAFGTKIQIDDKVYVVADRGGAIKVDNNGVYHIDMWVPTKKEANKYGRQRKTIRIFRR